LRDRHTGNIAVHRRIEHRYRNAAGGNTFQQIGGIRVTPLRQNNTVVFLADGLIDEILEFRVIAVTEESTHLKAQFAAFLNGAGHKLRGVVI